MTTTIMWLGQGGYLVKTAHGSFAVDPFCGEAKGNGKRLYPTFIPKGSEHVDMVLTTHDHWDHFDPETYRDYIIPDVIVGPGSCMDALKKSGLPQEGILLSRGNVLNRSGFKITATTADHTPDSIGYLVEFEECKLYFTGDTLFTTKLLTDNYGMRPDVTFICINGKLGNMGYSEAAAYCKIIETKVAVPNHYDMMLHNTENPKEFTDSMEQTAPEISYVVLETNVEYPLEAVVKADLQ